MILHLRQTGLAATGLLLLAGCDSVASWDCNRIAEKSVELSQSQPIRFRTITNVRETSRSQNDARCEGSAQLVAGGSGPIYMRAYLDGSNIMVAYQGTPWDGQGAAPAAPAAPAPQGTQQPSDGVPGYDQPASDQQQPQQGEGQR